MLNEKDNVKDLQTEPNDKLNYA